MLRLGKGLAWASLLALGGCMLEVNPTEQPARLRVTTVPETASVYLDDRYLGNGRHLARRAHDTRPGSHLLTVTADGYFPHDLELTLPAGNTEVRVALRAVPP